MTSRKSSKNKMIYLLFISSRDGGAQTLKSTRPPKKKPLFSTPTNLPESHHFQQLSKRGA